MSVFVLKRNKMDKDPALSSSSVDEVYKDEPPQKDKNADTGEAKTSTLSISISGSLGNIYTQSLNKLYALEGQVFQQLAIDTAEERRKEDPSNKEIFVYASTSETGDIDYNEISNILKSDKEGVIVLESENMIITPAMANIMDMAHGNKKVKVVLNRSKALESIMSCINRI